CDLNNLPSSAAKQSRAQPGSRRGGRGQVKICAISVIYKICDSDNFFLLTSALAAPAQPWVTFEFMTQRIASDFREMYFDGNWTCTNLRDMVKDIPWQQAATSVHNLNSILALVYHIHYYVRVVTRVLQGGPLSGSDKKSYNHPSITSQQEWEEFLATVWKEGEEFAQLIEQLP